MCGIVGYIGREDALPILLEGLKSLEYRGYDSAGVFVLEEDGSRLERAVGKVRALEEKLALKNKKTTGKAGIAHTRWATHGGVTEANAHPHADCTGALCIVHNGIIENHKELKRTLEKKGHSFRSETDSEVLAHLIEDERKKRNVSIEEAVRRALMHVRGTYGIVVLDSREPNKLVAARNFSPLMIGIGSGEVVIASDQTAILPRTKDVVYLKDGELAVLTAEDYRIFTIQKKDVERRAERLLWDAATAEKGGFPHFMLKEIFEEPDAIRNSIRGRLLPKQGEAVLGGLRDAGAVIRRMKRLVITGCGTAYFAGKVGEYMVEEYAGVPVKIEIASELRYRKQPFGKGDILLAVSQSGETADTLGVLREAKKHGVPTLGVVNVVGSTIARETDAGVYQHAGPEIAVASTKAFVSQVAVMALLSLFFGRKRGLSATVGRRIASELERIPELMEKVLGQHERVASIARKYAKYDDFFFLGRKYHYPVALEGALKLKEVSYAHAEGYSGGELKHGAIAMIDERFPTIALVTKDSVREKMLSNLEEVKARGGPIFAVATEGDAAIGKIADDVVYIPETLEMPTPLVSVIPLHLFAYFFGVNRGLDVDTPRNLAKSVTVE